MGCACGGSKKTPGLEYVVTERRSPSKTRTFDTKPEARAYAASVQGGATVVARNKTAKSG